MKKVRLLVVSFGFLLGLIGIILTIRSMDSGASPVVGVVLLTLGVITTVVGVAPTGEDDRASSRR